MSLIFGILPKSIVFRQLIEIFGELTGVKWGFDGLINRCKYISSVEIPVRVGIKRKKNVDLYIPPEIVHGLESAPAWARCEIGKLLQKKRPDIKLFWTTPEEIQMMIDHAEEQNLLHPVTAYVEKNPYYLSCNQPL